MADYQNFLKGLEKRIWINLTAGEFTASLKVLAKEDSLLANKPDIETFDKFTRNRRSNIVRRPNILKIFPSEETDKAQIGANNCQGS